MAQVVDAKHSELIGTPDQLLAFLRKVRGDRSAVLDLQFSRFVILSEPLTEDQVKDALNQKPKRKRK